MCGRFALTAPASTIAEVFQVDVLPDVLPRYNVAPTTEVACVVQDAEGKRVLETFRWGLVPSWAKDKKAGASMINARAETVTSKPAFRSAWKRRRLLVVADGFYEWERTDPKNKVPHLIGVTEGRLFAMAGLYEFWTDPETGEKLKSCTIVTTTPNPLMEGIHDRMPVILPPAVWDRWLDPKTPPETLTELLAPYPADGMQERKVSKRVGDVKNKGAEVQGPWEG
jgi:putative SOS response-associated peptidase YedK